MSRWNYVETSILSRDSDGNKKAEGGSLHSQLSTNQSLNWIPVLWEPETTRDTAELSLALSAREKD